MPHDRWDCAVEIDPNVSDFFVAFGRPREKTPAKKLLMIYRNFLTSGMPRRLLAMIDHHGESLTVHRLELPATLHVTLLSTNVIENVIRNCLATLILRAA